MLTRILIIGDSEVRSALKIFGFGSVLNDRFRGEADVIVRKFPGYTAEWIKLLISCVARNLGDSPDYVIIFCGRDDCLRSKKDKRPVTDPDSFRKNLYALVDKFTNEVDIASEKIILISPLPIHSMRFDNDEENNAQGLTMDKNMIRKYTEKTKEVAKKVGGQFIDSTELLDRALDANICPNGIKLSRDGHLALTDKLTEVIELSESPFPDFENVGQDYKNQLDKICKKMSMVKEENISAYTNVTAVDQYKAYMGKSYRGKV